MRRLTKLGLILTGVWLFLFVAIVCIKFQFATEMSLNELGDFLAGASAPMALLWLVIGYFQHGDELRLNTKALEAQQEELRQQVAETALLAQNAERHAEATEKLALLTRMEQVRDAQREARAAQPEFIFGGSTISGREIVVKLQNRGGEARNVRAEYSGPHHMTSSLRAILELNAIFSLKITQTSNITIEYPIVFSIFCADLLGTEHSFTFEYSQNEGLNEVSHERKSSASSHSDTEITPTSTA